ncbi:MAG: hypothetical protein SPF54_08115, partial [Helicobacter sp.]|nr:hypothetical protein [Helicobacter sp.]
MQIHNLAHFKASHFVIARKALAFRSNPSSNLTFKDSIAGFLRLLLFIDLQLKAGELLTQRTLRFFAKSRNDR